MNIVLQKFWIKKMINFFYKILIFITINILFFSNSFSKENKILFKVENEIITTIDIYNEIKYLEIINDKQFLSLGQNKIIEIAKNSLIREKIKEIELLKRINSLEIDQNILNEITLNYFKKNNIETIMEFENYFKNLNIDPNLIRKKIKIEILWNQLIYQIFNKNVKIDSEAIKNEIKNNKKIKELLLSEIVFTIDENEKLNDKFELIKERILNNSFSDAALIFSISESAKNGGNLGWIKETSINKKIKNEIKNMALGQHSKPLVIPGGFLIIKIEQERYVDVDADIDKEFDLIVKKKTNDQLNQYSIIYLNKVKKDIQINEL